jgi:putative membrane protein (TIGR04086 family)
LPIEYNVIERPNGHWFIVRDCACTKGAKDMSNVKWGRVALWIVLGTILAFVVANLFVLVPMVVRGIQLRGAPPREEQIALILSPAYNVAAILSTALGALLGGRATARKAEGNYASNGLVVGVGVGILMAVYSMAQRGEFTLWTVLHAILGVAGGYLGGVLGGRSAEAEDMYD